MMGAMRVLVAVAVVVCAVLAGQARAASEPGVRDARLSGIASAIVGKPVTVRCASFATLREISGADNAGVTVYATRTIYFATPGCDVLAQVKGRPETRTTWGGSSLRTFVHETWHMRGITDESETECRALREIGQVALQRFHVTDRRWLHDAIGYAWAGHRSLPADYTRLC